MADEVVLVQGLLDEEQGELVEPGQVTDVSSSVRAVRVHLQHQIVSEAVPDRFYRCQVPTGLDLELEPPVSGVEVLGDRVQQLVDRAHDADGDPRCHCAGDTAQEGAERDARRAQLRVQHRHLHSGLGHAVTLELVQERLDLGGAQIRCAEQSRPEVTPEREPGRVEVLRAVQRIGACDALAPTFALVGLHADQQRFTDGLGSERRAER